MIVDAMGQANHAVSADAMVTGGVVLSPKLFQAMGGFITEALGIKMPESKRTMLQSRLQKRLRQLKMGTFEEYYEYIFSSQGREEEFHHFLDTVTTNKTDFFREPKHYQVLVEKVLPEMMRRRDYNAYRPLRIWSAGCSTGAEPYTLAMVLEDFAESHPGFRYRILATDISTRVLTAAQNAIYDEKDADPIPMPLKKKYLLRSKNRSRPSIRVAPEIRQRVIFRRLNFMDSDYGLPHVMDIIFCRNVIIYFDRDTQNAVLQRLSSCLQPGGFLFLGHSETLNGFDLPLRQVAATVHSKRQ